MREYLENLIPELSLPLMMYNMPSHTKMQLSLETVKRAKELGAIGIKDSSGDMAYFYALIEEFKDSPDFSIITGTELFIPESIINGGDGAVAGGANFFPKLYVDLYKASVINDKKAIAELRKKVIKVYDTIYSVGKHSSRITKGTKTALSVMGICNDYMAQPLRKFKAAERKKIKEYIEEFDNIN